jgi:hypothetical protein
MKRLSPDGSIRGSCQLAQPLVTRTQTTANDQPDFARLLAIPNMATIGAKRLPAQRIRPDSCTARPESAGRVGKNCAAESATANSARAIDQPLKLTAQESSRCRETTRSDEFSQRRRPAMAPVAVLLPSAAGQRGARPPSRLCARKEYGKSGNTDRPLPKLPAQGSSRGGKAAAIEGAIVGPPVCCFTQSARLAWIMAKSVSARRVWSSSLSIPEVLLAWRARNSKRSS